MEHRVTTPDRAARPSGAGAAVGATGGAVRAARHRARLRPEGSAVALVLCLGAGMLGGIVATASQEPEASREAVAGMVDQHLSAEAAAVVRDVVAAAERGTGRVPPPAPQVGQVLTSDDDGFEADAAGVRPAPTVSPAPEAPTAVVPKIAVPAPEPTPSAAPVPDPGSGLTGTTVEPALSGELVIAAGGTEPPGPGKVWTVRVEVEKGLPVDVGVFADAVLATLNDPRGWSQVDGVTFARTDGDAPDARVVLTSPATTDTLCAPLDTGGHLSCGMGNAAVLNFGRWVNGAEAFGDDVVTYRQYLVNHEVGHVLGHHHAQCPAPGALAPVMVQQTLSTGGCLPNGWPRP
ncbi:DUF3152 domain-containing protein [Antribacter gilvus]|uniref:DUF3152 domain-containing protein n=1 Tax=Antribacter gilvus TaxID=2304675 RepID=UPI0013DEB660|nr:DUF3152 domain-containing protein [Antribacter gilvus]